MFRKKKNIFAFLSILLLIGLIFSKGIFAQETSHVSYTVGLHGIGSSGDAVNPNTFQLSNKNPLRPTRGIALLVTDANGQLTASLAGIMTFNTSTGFFSGDMPASLTAGTYYITLHVPGYIRKRIDTPFTFASSSAVVLPSIHLVSGDVDGDNQLSVLDFNTIFSCYSDLLPPRNCPAEKKNLADLTDDGKVNLSDFNLFLRELSVKK